MSQLPLSGSFEYLQCGDRLYTSESDVCRRQILTHKDSPRTARVKTIFAEYTDTALALRCRLDH